MAFVHFVCLLSVYAYACAAPGTAVGSGYSPGAPIYGFLSAVEREADLRCNGGRDLRTVMASYPRSGNSLLRRLLEEATGTITGSDTRPDRTLSRSLSVFGMQGEGVVDHRVRVVKTHYPERAGWRKFEGKKAILLVRNPFDAINSYFNMTLTNTHDQSLHESMYEEFHKLWDGMIRNEIKVWERFHRHWLSRGVPVRAVRYEDLLTCPEECLRDLIAFIYEIPAAEVEHTFGDRIRRTTTSIMTTPKKKAVAEGGTGRATGGTSTSSGGGGVGGGAGGGGGGVAAGPYRRRSSGSGVGGSIARHFCKGQVACCVREAGTLLKLFGYDPESQGFPPAVRADLLDLHGRVENYIRTIDACPIKALATVGAPGEGAEEGEGGGEKEKEKEQETGKEEEEEENEEEEEKEMEKDGGEEEEKGSGDVAHGEKPPAGVEGGIGNERNKNQVPLVVRDEIVKTISVTKNAFSTGIRDLKTVTVNLNTSSMGVREEQDVFGRGMTPFRRSHTKRDTQPLPLKGEDEKAVEWGRRKREEEKMKEVRGARAKNHRYPL